MLKLSFLIAALSLFLCVGSQSEAALIQILHTNDLHAALETFGSPEANQAEYGGWAQLKSVMDRLTAEAKSQGIETVKLDAGDFTEGSVFYFSDHGKSVIRAFQHLGYDAAAMGNHDWLMGAEEMNSLYGELPFPFPVLSANTKIDRSLQNLNDQIKPSTQIERGRIKIGIFGLSTDEVLYNWIPKVDSFKKAMTIQDYRDQTYLDDGEAGTRVELGIANKVINKLRKSSDVVIGLTHIGYEEDKFLAANSQGLDLVIGGHSHTFLSRPTWIADRDGKRVPVVQTGFNGKYVGKIILDVEPGKRTKIVSYDLVPVLKDSPKDPIIEADIQAAEKLRDVQFGTRLGEVIGSSEDRLVSGDAGPTSFSKFAVDAIRDITQDDIALDVGAFHGNTPQAAGDVTRLKLMEMYPRKFESDQNEGLYVYEAVVPGILVKLGLKYIVRFGTYVATSGITYDIQKLSDKEFAAARKSYGNSVDAEIMTPYYPDNIKVNGEPLRLFSWYSLAAPESLVRGAMALSPLMHLVIHRPHPTPHTIWDAMNAYLLKVGKIEHVEPMRGPSPWSPEIRTPHSIMKDFVIEGVNAFQKAPKRAISVPRALPEEYQTN